MAEYFIIVISLYTPIELKKIESSLIVKSFTKILCHEVTFF